MHYSLFCAHLNCNDHCTLVRQVSEQEQYCHVDQSHPINSQTDAWTYRLTDGHTERLTDIQIDRQNYGQKDRWLFQWMEVWTHRGVPKI